MTVAVACWTICGEVAGKQVHLTLTKPVPRWQYLLGKWLGLACLNLLLLAVTGLGVYVFARALDAQPAADAIDRAAVEQQVLTARLAITPQPPNPADLRAQAEKRFEELRNENPKHYPQRYAELDPRTRSVIENGLIDEWHSIPGNDYHSFLFRGLTPPTPGAALTPLKLRLKPKVNIGNATGLVFLNIRANGYVLGNASGDSPAFRVIEKGTLEIDVPPSLVSPTGDLQIDIFNPLANSRDPENLTPITFNPGEGLKLFRDCGSFAPNLARAMAVIWARMLFLAALGLAAGSFLSFPVACMTAMVLTSIAYASSFLDEALSFFADLPNTNQPVAAWIINTTGVILQTFASGKIAEGLKMLIKLFLMGLMAITPSLARNDPVSAITGGEMVSYPALGQALLEIGLIGSVACGVVAWLIFRRRELARVIV
jgi:hypothetical protein